MSSIPPPFDPGSPIGPAVSRDMKTVYSRTNLRLAWERLLRSQEPQYKWFWRPALGVVSTIIDSFLKRLRLQLKADTFRTEHACYISEPKSSGLLRHRAILSIGDLVVYQAFGNVIADKVWAKTRKRYGKSIFGNLYRGPRDLFYLQDWRKSYRSFTNANKAAFKGGNTWLAQFDFASFYDSIDYSVLKTILVQEFGVGTDLCERLTDMLERWSSAGGGTAKMPRIYMRHGIPQGPMTSAILAEAILSYIDKELAGLKYVKYLRYADDIRIWGTDEASVRRAATLLDRLSRNIGIFPQPGKFKIHLVTDLDEVIKEISIPGSYDEPDDDDFEELHESLQAQPSVRKLWELLREFVLSRQVKDVTTFKFLLGSTCADNLVAERLCVLMEIRPELTETCCRYIQRVRSPSAKLLDLLLALLDKYPGYPWMRARILLVLEDFRAELSVVQARSLKAKVLGLKNRKGIETDCFAQGVGYVAAISSGCCTPLEVEIWAKDSRTPWWGLAYFIQNVDESKYGSSALIGLLQTLLSHTCPEVARAAALRMCLLLQTLPNCPLDPHGEVAEIFTKHQLSAPRSATRSRINDLLHDLKGDFQLPSTGLHRVNWLNILGAQHDDIERMIIRLPSQKRTSPESFILQLDAALETVFDLIWALSSYTDVTSSGKVIRNPNRGKRLRHAIEFEADLPITRTFLIGVNNLRNRSETTHLRNTYANSVNRRISEGDVKRAIALMDACLAELATKFPEP